MIQKGKESWERFMGMCEFLQRSRKCDMLIGEIGVPIYYENDR